MHTDMSPGYPSCHRSAWGEAETDLQVRNSLGDSPERHPSPPPCPHFTVLPSAILEKQQVGSGTRAPLFSCLAWDLPAPSALPAVLWAQCSAVQLSPAHLWSWGSRGALQRGGIQLDFTSWYSGRDYGEVEAALRRAAKSQTPSCMGKWILTSVLLPTAGAACPEKGQRVTGFLTTASIRGKVRGAKGSHRQGECWPAEPLPPWTNVESP